MNKEIEIRIVVEVTRTEKRELHFHHDHVAGREIKERAGVGLESKLFAIKGDKFHHVPNDDRVLIKNGEIFVVIPHGAIHYMVNDEPQWTCEKELTPVMIIRQAGVDPAQNYLVEIKEHGRESFKDTPEKPIHMHNGMKFITHFTGTKPVSNF